MLWEHRGLRHKIADDILSWSRQVATILSPSSLLQTASSIVCSQIWRTSLESLNFRNLLRMLYLILRQFKEQMMIEIYLVQQRLRHSSAEINSLLKYFFLSPPSPQAVLFPCTGNNKWLLN